MGYNSITRSLAHPVLPSMPVSSSTSQSFKTTRYDNAKDWVTEVFSGSLKSAGLYVLDDAHIVKMLSIFGDYTQNIGISQKHYSFYSAKVSSVSPLPQFIDFIQSIPAEYDPKNETLVHYYKLFVQAFGTDVVTD